MAVSTCKQESGEEEEEEVMHDIDQRSRRSSWAQMQWGRDCELDLRSPRRAKPQLSQSRKDFDVGGNLGLAASPNIKIDL